MGLQLDKPDGGEPMAVQESMRVLLIGTESEVAEKANLAIRLRWPDAAVLVAAVTADSFEVVEREEPSLVLYQANTADGSPEKFIHELRAFSDVPLIVLEQQAGEQALDQVKALESGADDYIPRSAGIIDLVARIVALMRRVRRVGFTGESHLLSSGSLLLDPATYEVFLHGNRLTLTATEFRLLHVLLNHRGTVITHELLETSLWGDRVDRAALVKKYIQRLRRKLGDDPRNPQWIANVHSVGYRFVGPRVQEPEPAGMVT